MKNFSLLLLIPFLSAISLNAFCLSDQTKKTTPEKERAAHFLVQGDLLYWVPQVSGLDTNFGSGSVTQYTTGGVATTISNETDVDPVFEWHPGYRVSLGTRFDSNRWEVGGIWTDFQGSAHKSIDHGHWNVKLKQLDLATFYRVCVSPSVTLQPSIGLRATSIFQKLSSQINTPVIILGSGTATDTRTFRDNEQFYGLGPLFGLNSNFNVKYGLSFYGTIAFGLLYGNYHLHFNDRETVTAPATPSYIQSKIKKNMKAFDFDLDLALGIQWQYLIHKVGCLTMKLGLENHQYFNQSRLGNKFGNLSFSGGIFSFGLAI